MNKKLNENIILSYLYDSVWIDDGFLKINPSFVLNNKFKYRIKITKLFHGECDVWVNFNITRGRMLYKYGINIQYVDFIKYERSKKMKIIFEKN